MPPGKAGPQPVSPGPACIASPAAPLSRPHVNNSDGACLLRQPRGMDQGTCAKCLDKGPPGQRRPSTAERQRSAQGERGFYS